MWFNPIMAGLLRSPLHPVLSHNTMLMTVRGRKTGRKVTTPVNYVRRGDELLTVSLRSRTWWRNLRGRPTPVEVVLAGARRKGSASVDEAEAEVKRGLTDVAAASPMMARALHLVPGADGRPRPEDLTEAAQSRVIVRTQLSSES